jgi:ketosteroid isomerase-like protein
MSSVTADHRTTDPAVEEVVALDKENCRAFVARDVARLDQLWSDSLLVNSPINRVHEKQRVLELLQRGVIAHCSLESEIEAARRDGDTVIVMGAEIVRDSPHSPVLRRRYTNVWRRENGSWRLFIRHANSVT